MKDLAIGDEKQTALERKASKAEDNFTVVAKTLEDREAALHVKEAQLIKALDCHRSLKGRTVAKTRELRLLSADLQKCLDA